MKYRLNGGGIALGGELIRLGQVGIRNQQNLYPRIPTTDVAKLL